MTKLWKVKILTFWLWKVKLWSALNSNVVWILEKWMRIHARNVEISQDEQNSKKSKCWLFYLKKWNFEFDLNVKLPYCSYTNLNNNTYCSNSWKEYKRRKTSKASFSINLIIVYIMLLCMLIIKFCLVTIRVKFVNFFQCTCLPFQSRWWIKTE